MATKNQGVACYDKAGPDEPLFVLRAQDIMAPELVRKWARGAVLIGVGEDKILEAFKVAEDMEKWQTANKKKVPD